MFDVTPDEIAELNDVDLRELVGLLCAAELGKLGLSVSAVTYGGNQTAADGGLDVRVALPPGTLIDGFVPRASTGFQVKTPDMARAAILEEMRPKHVIRPVIKNLADESGAYIIASSHGSVADSALQSRREALREALADVANATQLYTDFYDRTRLATWVREHAGLVVWVKEKVGRSLVGWRPYGAWARPAEGAGAEYLLDDRLRLRLGGKENTDPKSVTDALDDLRDRLAMPGKMVRLVGLSGVGKTRLVQALFDSRLGARPLARHLAVYTNLADGPDPQPIALASDLIARRVRAIMIVDNCPSDLHRRLVELCSSSDSTVSVITVEYDVRDDQPEGTQVATLDTSSPGLIEKLVRQRFPHISQVDARTIAEASGGNARIAIALSETVGQSETISGLSDEDLFLRLFRQRHADDDGLLQAAQMLSLVYSFDGEALAGAGAELPRLAALADQTPSRVYRHVNELHRRNLVQKRGAWRAVLPHALANRLAAHALEDVHPDTVEEQLVTGAAVRLCRSFSRRLSFLHENAAARTIVQRWLAPGGYVGDVSAFDDDKKAIFENVAPVLPEAALEALERLKNADPGVAAFLWHRHRALLRSLAYDVPLFGRSAALLACAATQYPNERYAKEALEAFTSLFTIYLSGTHATIGQRLDVIERLLRSGEAKDQALGLAALREVLKTGHFNSFHRFDFGARSRNYGYRPHSNDDVSQWYRTALALIDRLAADDDSLRPKLRGLVAANFRGLWNSLSVPDELEDMFRRIAMGGFWREGWMACRKAMRFGGDKLVPESSSRLAALEVVLKPISLLDEVRAFVLGTRSSGLELGEMDPGADIATELERLEANALELGVTVAGDPAVLTEMAPDLLHGAGKAWSFGRGLARGAKDRGAVWTKLVAGLGQVSPEERDVGAMVGYLVELSGLDGDLAQNLLDAAIDQPDLAGFVPALQSGVPIDTRGAARLIRALKAGRTPVQAFRWLAGRPGLPEGADFKALLSLILEESGGFDVALEILSMRLHSDQSEKREHEPELVEIGQELLRRVRFRKNRELDAHSLGTVVRACLVGAETAPVAADVARRLRQAVADHETYAYENDELLKALLLSQPLPVLDALFEGTDDDRFAGVGVFDHSEGHHANPADGIPGETLIAWCDRDGDPRYPIAASIVSFARNGEVAGSKVWSEHAWALLTHAPDPGKVLDVFVGRFRPMSGSGSTAVEMEANARLLDSLDMEFPVGFRPLVAAAKDRMTREIGSQREWETKMDRGRDEAFE